MELNDLFHPIVATPFRHDDGYIELPPCAALRPYVRCFWSSSATAAAPQLVVPDACMDILFQTDPLTRAVKVRFCGINDEPFHAQRKDGYLLTFGIRFYAWSASLFAEDNLNGTKNGSFDAEMYFPSLVHRLKPQIERANSFDEQIQGAQQALLHMLDPQRLDPAVLNAIWLMLLRRGNLRAAEVAPRVHISARQLERLFAQRIGVSPKGFMSLARYQFLWRDAALSQRFDVQDAVERYGYADQSHLLRSFHAFHDMPLKAALQYARQNVVFLQDRPAHL